MENRLFQPFTRRSVEADRSAVLTHAPRLPGAAEEEMRLAKQVDVTVLVTAENPHDREACARVIHAASRYSRGPFVIVSGKSLNAGAEEIVSADRLAEARGGTLFVDDVAELNAIGQAQLLSLVETREAAVRVVAGASRHLERERASGVFSETLFYRLNIIHVNLKEGSDS